MRESQTIGTVTAVWGDAFNRVTLGHGRRLTQFGLVGILGVAVNTTVLFLLVQAGHLNHLVAAGISSEVSILGNFALNDRWTFRDVDCTTSWIRRVMQYNAVALSGMVISLLTLAALTLGLGMHYLLANLVAIGTATLSNYALNTRFTWARRPELLPVLAESSYSLPTSVRRD
jgi:dolichol-phosphate mannosyltransferase